MILDLFDIFPDPLLPEYARVLCLVHMGGDELRKECINDVAGEMKHRMPQWKQWRAEIPIRD